MQLNDLDKDKLIRVLYEDIAAITKNSIEVLLNLRSIKGQDLNNVSDFIQAMKVVNQRAIKEIEKIAGNTEKPS